MKVVAVGAGAWGVNIIRTLHEIGALSCIVEASESGRAKMAADYPDVRIAATLDEVLDDIDAVTIATPVPTHAALAAQALHAGKPTFVEKPITMTLAEAEALVALAERKGLPLMVGHLLIYQPAVQWIIEQVQGGIVGQLRGIRQERLNLGRARSAENVLWSLGVHDVAVILSLIGEEPIRIKAVGEDHLTQGVEDDTTVHMEFPSGVRAHLHNSWLWPDRSRRMVVVGSKAMLVYDELAQTVTLHKKSIDEGLNNVDEGTEVVFEGAAQPLRLEMEHFLDCARTGAEPKTSGRSALAVVKVLEAATADIRS